MSWDGCPWCRLGPHEGCVWNEMVLHRERVAYLEKTLRDVQKLVGRDTHADKEPFFWLRDGAQLHVLIDTALGKIN